MVVSAPAFVSHLQGGRFRALTAAPSTNVFSTCKGHVLPLWCVDRNIDNVQLILLAWEGKNKREKPVCCRALSHASRSLVPGKNEQGNQPRPRNDAGGQMSLEMCSHSGQTSNIVNSFRHSFNVNIALRRQCSRDRHRQGY